MPVICTHSGRFHVDEVLACVILKSLPKYKNHDIVRSRDPKVIDDADIVVDVGAKFDPENNRFDHHQRGFEEVFDDEHVTKLSSAGLAYKYFGNEMLKATLDGSVGDEDLKTIYHMLYEEFVEGIDGMDNGIAQYGEAKPAYQESTHLGARVGNLNPAWNEENLDEDTQFMLAFQMVKQEFFDKINRYVKSWLPARELVKTAVEQRALVDSSGLILELGKSCPWKSHLFNIEKELNITPDNAPLYIIFGGGSDWRVQAIPPHANTFECRKRLPEAWQGIRNDELSVLTGVPDCVFCHANGFIGGNKTREGALKMAQLALQA